MNTGFRSQVVPEYRLLKDHQIYEFHRAALEVNAKICVPCLSPAEGLP